MIGWKLVQLEVYVTHMLTEHLHTLFYIPLPDHGRVVLLGFCTVFVSCKTTRYLLVVSVI